MTTTTATPTARQARGLLAAAAPLLRAVVARPGDDTTRLAFGDWLQDHGLSAAADLLTPELRRAARAEAGERRTSNIPVVFDLTDGTEESGVVGRGWYYTTKAGTEVRHPSAYKRVAKSAELVYHGSTRRVVVGPKWVLARI